MIKIKQTLKIKEIVKTTIKDAECQYMSPNNLNKNLWCNSKLFLENVISHNFKFVKVHFLKIAWSNIKGFCSNYYSDFQLRHSYRTINKILKFCAPNSQPQSLFFKHSIKHNIFTLEWFGKKNLERLRLGLHFNKILNIPFNFTMIKKTVPLTLLYSLLQSSNQK